MIRQITKFDLKPLLTRPSRKPVRVVQEEDETLMLSIWERQGEEVIVSDPKPLDLKSAINDREIHYHIVEKISPMVNESFGDGDSEDFMKLAQLLYYTTDECQRDWVDQMVGIYRSSVEGLDILLSEDSNSS